MVLDFELGSPPPTPQPRAVPEAATPPLQSPIAANVPTPVRATGHKPPQLPEDGLVALSARIESMWDTVLPKNPEMFSQEDFRSFTTASLEECGLKKDRAVSQPQTNTTVVVCRPAWDNMKWMIDPAALVAALTSGEMPTVYSVPTRALLDTARTKNYIEVAVISLTQEQHILDLALAGGAATGAEAEAGVEDAAVAVSSALPSKMPAWPRTTNPAMQLCSWFEVAVPMEDPLTGETCVFAPLREWTGARRCEGMKSAGESDKFSKMCKAYAYVRTHVDVGATPEPGQPALPNKDALVVLATAAEKSGTLLAPGKGSSWYQRALEEYDQHQKS
jgi:hypothetical protein